MQPAGTELDWLRVGDPFSLRPSLRAACILHQRFGLDRLGALIHEGNVTAIAQIIATCSVVPIAAEDVLASLVKPPLAPTLDRLLEPLTDILYGLAGIDPDEPVSRRQRDPETGRKPTWAEIHTTLFRQATGWCGMSPAEAWASTPIEIAEAMKGRLDMLSVLVGHKLREDDDDDREPDAEEVRAGLAKLRALSRGGSF